MDYLSFTEQQLQKRYYSLPEKLRNVLDSGKNAELVNRICNNHYLKDEDKIVVVEQLIALVILGFIEFQELKKEISDNLNLNVQHSADIASEINKIIFEPIKADIEKNYKPAVSEPLPIKPVMSESKPAEKPAEAAPEKPKPFSPLDILKETPVAVSKPQASVAPKIVGSAPFSAPKPFVPPVISKENPIIPSAAKTDGPLIIHKEAEFKPLSESKKSLGGFFSFLNKGAEKREIKDVVSPVKAKIEIGPETFGVKPESKPSPIPASQEKKPAEPPKAKIVNYSGIPSSVSANPFSPASPVPAGIKTAGSLPGQTPKPAEFKPQIPEAAPKPTLKDLSKPMAPIAPKPPVFSAPVLQPTPQIPTVPKPSAVPEQKPLVSPAPIAPKMEEKPVKNPPEENVIDLRSFK